MFLLIERFKVEGEMLRGNSSSFLKFHSDYLNNFLENLPGRKTRKIQGISSIFCLNFAADVAMVDFQSQEVISPKPSKSSREKTSIPIRNISIIFYKKKKAERAKAALSD
jgi:hypothetical protein